MSKLPPGNLRRSSVAVGDAKVEFRSLSRKEAMHLGTFEGDPDGAEGYVLACAVEITVDEAQAWRAETQPDDVGVLVDAILELSGLTEGAQKSGGTGDRPGGG